MGKPDSLYYICHIDNLQSILEGGIFSRQKIDDENIPHQPIHAPEVLARRDKEVCDGKKLSRYVNLYFQPRNAMLYRLQCNLDINDLVIVQVNSSVMDESGTYFTDRNAAASVANFYADIKDVNLDKRTLKKEYWSDADDSKQRMMAEALVEDVVARENIITVYTAKENDEVKRLAGNHSVEYSIEPHMFFRPQYQRWIAKNVSLSKGDMFFSHLQTFTISVNLQGVMGKGLASRTKYQFPDAYVRYQDDCKSKRLKAGHPTLYKRNIRIEDELADDSSMLDTSRLNGFRWFLFLATKRRWSENSRFEDIEASMQWLVKKYKEQDIQSIAMPALGCGLGNLQWQEVGPMMCYYLSKMDITSCIYLPMEQEIDSSYLESGYLLNNYRP